MVEKKVYQIVGEHMEVGGDLLKVQLSFSYDVVPFIKFKVLAMDDRLRNNGQLISRVERGSTYSISSKSCPEIRENCLYVRGSTSAKDDIETVWIYSSLDERNRALNAFTMMVEALNNISVPEVSERGGCAIYKVAGPKCSVTFELPQNRPMLQMVVSYLDDQHRSTSTLTEVKEDDGRVFRLVSSGCPELSDDRIYLWGSDRCEDSKVCTRMFANDANRMEYLQRCLKVLNKFNYPWL